MPSDFKLLLETVIYLGVLFALLPVVFYVLSKAGSPSLYPESFELEEIRKLARLLYAASEKSLEEATRRFHSSARERRALEDLIRLAERSEQFRSRLDAEVCSGAGLRRHEFLQLELAFERSQASIQHLASLENETPSSFQSVTQAMDSLRFHFEIAPFLPPEEAS